MTAILFGDGVASAEQTALLEQLRKLDPALCVRWRFRAQGFSSAQASDMPTAMATIARLFDAAPGTLYLLRPDLHIAGRWKTIVPAEILLTAAFAWGNERHEPDAVRRPRSRLRNARDGDRFGREKRVKRCF